MFTGVKTGGSLEGELGKSAKKGKDNLLKHTTSEENAKVC